MTFLKCGISVSAVKAMYHWSELTPPFTDDMHVIIGDMLSNSIAITVTPIDKSTDYSCNCTLTPAIA